MKKLTLSLITTSTLLLGSENILGEFTTPTNEKASMLSVDISTWYIGWTQTSTASDFLQNSADSLDTTYNIDNALAALLKLNFNYKYLYFNTEYCNNGSVDSLEFDAALLKLIPFVTFEIRYTKAHFNGDIKSRTSASSNLSTGVFDSDLEIVDIIAYPYNDYFGLGYRNYKYELPQDVYLINNTTGATTLAGLANVSYEGSFYTATFDNKKRVSSRKNYNGLLYSVMAGIGKLEPKTQGFSTWTSKSDALFYDVQLEYRYKTQSKQGFGYGVGVGYRYNKIDTSHTKADSTHSLVTEFNTEFHGPVVDVSVNF